jgi:hypothetical protein
VTALEHHTKSPFILSHLVGIDGHVGDALRFCLTGHTAVNKDSPQEFVPERLRNE